MSFHHCILYSLTVFWSPSTLPSVPQDCLIACPPELVHHLALGAALKNEGSLLLLDYRKIKAHIRLMHKFLHMEKDLQFIAFFILY